MHLKDFDPRIFREDAAISLAPFDIEILATVLEIAQVQPSRQPFSATAERLGLTVGRVRHRTFKTAKTLERFEYRHLHCYLTCLQEVFSRPGGLPKAPPN